jgi:hypothetical protein
MNSADRKLLAPWLVAAALFVALVLCLLWIMLHDCEDASDVDGSGDSTSQRSSGDFIISGTTTPQMKPGVSAPLDLSLTNTSDVAILVSSLTVTVREVTAPNADAGHPCSAADFTVHQAADGIELSLSAGETGRLSTLQLPLPNWPRVQMMNRPVNQDGCKQATLTLDYSGAGQRDE